jgi:hypothetical protein
VRPTREGGVTPWRPGLLFTGYGVSPEVVVEEPDPPDDRVDEFALAFVPLLPPDELGAATDLNLDLGTCSDGGGIRPVTDPTNANDGNISSIAGRSSYFNGSGTDTWWLRSDLGSAHQVDQIVVRGGFGNAGENDPAWDIEWSDDNSSWTTAAGTYTWDDAPNPNTATLDLTSPLTHRYWRIGQSVGPGFIYPLKVHTWQINGPQTITPSSVEWAPAPETRDDDDATGAYASSDSVDAADNVIWRGTLGDTYFVASLRALVGFETAGSVTVEVQGANEADYSDAVTLGSDTITATGSMTGDELAASWAADAGYLYWQLVIDAPDGVTVYEVSLYDPTPFTGAHVDLTGRDAAAQHPADAVTVVPFGSIAATDVQAALEEIVAEAGSTLTVDDGTTSVSPVDTIVFDGATVTDDTGGQVTVEIAAGGATPLELDYVQITSPVNITATTEGTANTIITGSAITYDGNTPVIIEAFFPYWQLPNNSDGQVWLYDSGSSIGTMALASVITATGITGTQRQHLRATRRLTPSAGSHTYSLRGTTSTGTGIAGAGAGGAATHPPAYLRITAARGGMGVGAGVGVKLYNSTTQSVNNTTATPLTMDTEVYDTHGFHTGSSSQAVVPAGMAGKYIAVGGTYFPADTDGSYRIVAIGVNGSAVAPHTRVPPKASATADPALTATAIVNLNVGDYVELIAYHDSGAAASLGHASNAEMRSSLSLMRFDSGAASVPLDNLTATANPAVTDDAADGYSAGSRWLNTTTGTWWVCTVATTGAAVWHAQVNPIPNVGGHAGGFSAGTTSLAITTAAYAVGANLVFVVCSTARKPNAAPSQTNVTWTERYASSGNNAFVTVYTGVVAGGASGTTLTTTFASSTAVYAEVVRFDDSPIANFTACAAADTATAATTALATVAVGSMAPGGFYMWVVCAAAPSSSYSGLSQPYRHGISVFGGQGRMGAFRAQRDAVALWSLSSSAVNYFAVIVRLT